jgi:hypothetical protein
VDDRLWDYGLESKVLQSIVFLRPIIAIFVALSEGIFGRLGDWALWLFMLLVPVRTLGSIFCIATEPSL